MVKFKKVLCLMLALVMCFSLSITALAAEEATTETNEFVNSLVNPNGRVLSVARYGNPRVYPVDSLEGITSCIEMGVDIVTINVQLTKDEQLVVLSSTDISKKCVTAEGKFIAGKVTDYTLADLTALCLKEGYGGTNAAATQYKVVSLDQVIDAAKGKILIMINNGSKYIEKITAVAAAKEASDTVIIRGVDAKTKTTCHVATVYKDGTTSGSVKDFVESATQSSAAIVELSAEKESSKVFKDSTLSLLSGKSRAFVSTAKEELCGGKEDRQSTWAELIESGVSIIETDYPKELASYLKQIETRRTELTTLLASANEVDTKTLTETSATALQKAIEESTEITAKGCASYEQLDAAYYHLQEAIDSLTVSNGTEKSSLPSWAITLIVIGSIILVLVIAIFGLRTFNKTKRNKAKFEKFKEAFASDIPQENDENLSTNIAEDEESNMGIEDLDETSKQVEELLNEVTSKNEEPDLVAEENLDAAEENLPVDDSDSSDTIEASENAEEAIESLDSEDEKAALDAANEDDGNNVPEGFVDPAEEE